jgi:hypothetical protein
MIFITVREQIQPGNSAISTHNQQTNRKLLLRALRAFAVKTKQINL